MQTEMMSDAIDDVLDEDEAEEETEVLTNQVLGTSSHGSAAVSLIFKQIKCTLKYLKILDGL